METEKCSDDELSEGSSDGEGDEDDLSKKQFSKLFSCIKNKKYKNVDKCRFSPVKRTKTNELEEDEEDFMMDDDEENDKKKRLQNDSNLQNHPSQ